MHWLRERDIDLLICSELHFKEGPLHRLLVGGWNSGNVEFDGAWVSHHDSDGEVDILASFQSGSKSLFLLIENKIDAEFQPEQPQRYGERAQRWKDESSGNLEIETVLLGPEDYFENEGSEIFDRQVSYEEVIAALADSADSRTQFLAKTLKDGIEYHKHGYKALHNDSTTAIWGAIWKVANAEAPKLRMKKPGSKPAKAGFVHLEDAEGVSTPETQRRVKIVYKFKHGNADLQFSNTNERTIRNLVGNLLDSSMTVERAAKSASIRIKVPSVDPGRSPAEQEESIKQGIQAAEGLRVFCINKRLLELVLLD